MNPRKIAMQSPCAGEILCPFRKDCLKSLLGKERAIEIVESDSFVCHKNNDRQCAGHMLVSQSNVMVRVANAMGVDMKLDQDVDVFDSEQEFVEHHSE
jgi:hypothetical protein